MPAVRGLNLSQYSAPAPGFDVSLSHDGLRSRVQASGDLDLASAPQLKAAIDRVDHWPEHTVIVDLTALTFCDCAGLTVLLAGHHALRAEGGALIIVNPPPSTRKLLAVTGLEREFDVRPDDSPRPTEETPGTVGAGLPNLPGDLPCI